MKLLISRVSLEDCNANRLQKDLVFFINYFIKDSCCFLKKARFLDFIKSLLNLVKISRLWRFKDLSTNLILACLQSKSNHPLQRRSLALWSLCQKNILKAMFLSNCVNCPLVVYGSRLYEVWIKSSCKCKW